LKRANTNGKLKYLLISADTKKGIYLPIFATNQVKRSEEVVFSGCDLKLLPENVLFFNQPISLQSFDPGSIMDWIYQ